MSHYFNTTNETKQFLAREIHNCKNQEDIILIIFQRLKKLTASDVLAIYPNESVPLTSIRRAMSCLIGLGKLEKTEDKKIGIYGKPEKFYKVLS
jgi:hypothetical protein